MWLLYTLIMDKIERAELVRKGVTVLRSQYETRKSCWKIAKATRNGGLTHFGTIWYIAMANDDNKIDVIVEMDPQRYKKDE